MRTNKNTSSHPSARMGRFLEWFCPPQLFESIEGDLLEQVEIDRKEAGELVARRNYRRGVLKFFRLEVLLRHRFTFTLLDTIMLKNYLLLTFRNIVKNKIFATINILGLAIGLATCLFIFQFVSYELSYDTFHAKFDRMYRITNDRFQHGKLIQHGTITYPTIGPVMAKDFPEIEEYTRLMPGGEMNVKVGDRIVVNQDAIFTDEHFLSIFSFGFLEGDKKSALKERYSIVLTESTALKYFDVQGTNYQPLIGKQIFRGLEGQPYTVTGICQDVPENSHLQFDVLVSYKTLYSPEETDADDSWTWSDMRHYVVLKPGVSEADLEKKFDAFSERYFQGDKVSGSIEKFYLQPLKEAHLYSDFEYDIAKTASGKAVWAMLIVSIFILVLAWINYVNLTTSRALDRAKEVGLRKVMGALRSQVIRQFLIESILISFISFVIAIGLVALFQGEFNKLIEATLSFRKILTGIDSFTIGLFIVVMIVGVTLSGFYPAYALSSFQPVAVLKGKFVRSSRGQVLRKTLVVFQFTASAALVTATLIVSKQLKFMNEADLGVNINNTIIVQSPERTPWDSTYITRVESFKNELTQIKGVVAAATSNNIPGDRLGRSFEIRLSQQSAATKFTFSIMNVDHNFFDTYKIAVVAGRKFMPTDHKVQFADLNTVILNVQATKLLGIDNPENAIGQEIIWGGNGTRKWTIVGVVNDYHQESFRNKKEPMIFRPTYSTYHRFSILTSGVDPRQTLGEIESTYQRFFPNNAFDYTFLEDRYKNQYKDDNRFGKVVTVFMILGIFISCIGLVALSSYSAVQRTKEIGIRKVLGASVVSIVSLLSTDFIKLVLIASVLSLPITYFSVQKWLENYAYKIHLQGMMFLLPLLIIVVIAALTVAFQVLKAAMINPAKTLKHE